MGKQFLFLIAIMLSFVLGQAAEVIGIEPIDLTKEHFTAYVGQQDTHTISLKHVTNTNPVAMLNENRQQTLSDTNRSDDYSVTITGNDSSVFSAAIITILPFQSETTLTTYVTIEVTYSPVAPGSHSATVHLLNKNGISVASQKLSGEATLLSGDTDGDGVVDINDVTNLIDIILGNGYDGDNLYGDINGDGIVDITDVTELIDVVLGKPISRPFTFLILTRTDGSTWETMIDEKTKVTIEKPYLRIKTSDSPRPKSFSLDQIANLQYEVRTITINNDTKLANFYPNEEKSVTLNTMRP